MDGASRDDGSAGGKARSKDKSNVKGRNKDIAKGEAEDKAAKQSDGPSEG